MNLAVGADVGRKTGSLQNAGATATCYVLLSYYYEYLFIIFIFYWFYLSVYLLMYMVESVNLPCIFDTFETKIPGLSKLMRILRCTTNFAYFKGTLKGTF